jgi:hypothetical protein
MTMDIDEMDEMAKVGGRGYPRGVLPNIAFIGASMGVSMKILHRSPFLNEKFLG